MDFEGVKKALENKSAVIVDVREPDERQKGRIPGTEHIPRK